LADLARLTYHSAPTDGSANSALLHSLKPARRKRKEGPRVHTLKSACLVVVLLGVLYGVYTALNKPDFLAPTNTEPVEVDTPEIDYGASQQPYPATAAAGSIPSEISADRPSSTGLYQPNTETSPLPPPLAPPTTTPSGLQRSAYEAPITSPAAESGFGSSPGSSSESTAPPLTSVAPASSPLPSPAIAAYDLKHDLIEAEQLAAAGKFRAALAQLTPHYAASDLAPEERRLVLAWLDALAAKVIYSREHLLAPAHQVRRGEDLYKIAQQYNVEYRLLQNINQEVTDPLVLVPATELKVIPGPFRADVKLAAGELTLYVGELYAGRFSFALGDQPPAPGKYKVIDKRAQQKTYVGFDGRVVAANDPNNPYGGWWISLGGEVAIHGSPLVPSSQTLGCISLSPQDAKDVYSILSLGSEVTIEQ
jgi:hypothetical protein